MPYTGPVTLGPFDRSQFSEEGGEEGAAAVCAVEGLLVQAARWDGADVPTGASAEEVVVDAAQEPEEPWAKPCQEAVHISPLQVVAFHRAVFEDAHVVDDGRTLAHSVVHRDGYRPIRGEEGEVLRPELDEVREQITGLHLAEGVCELLVDRGLDLGVGRHFAHADDSTPADGVTKSAMDYPLR